MRGETAGHDGQPAAIHISIRSPHARGDTSRDSLRSRRSNFNPLPSHEGRPRPSAPGATPASYFNPLPSHEGRLLRALVTAGQLRYFNPLPSHEGRPVVLACGSHPSDFNPLPSHEGRPTRFLLVSPQNNFNPLPSHEGRRATLGLPQDCHNISIHSPHTRGDQPRKRRSADGQHFNPLPSHEGRRSLRACVLHRENFNPLPSHEGRQLH